MNSQTVYLGIDVSKENLDLAVNPGSKSDAFIIPLPGSVRLWIILEKPVPYW